MTSRRTLVRRRLAAAVFATALVGGLVAAGVYVLAPGGEYRLLGAPTIPALGGGASSGSPDGEIATGDRILLSDVDHPALANLDPDLLAAVQRAAADAEREEGIPFSVTSGWRSPEYQARLLSEAISDYGSEAEARRWVASPDRSLHVSGDAIDIGDFDATYWLSLHGAAYGLCQIYANERWHFELRPDAVIDGCPPQYLDPTEDPRLQG